MSLTATLQAISALLVAIPAQVTAAISSLTTLDNFLKANI